MRDRDLSEVIDLMLKEIPPTELRICLTGIQRSLAYAAPEAMGLWWRKVQKLLVREIGEPRPGWETKVANIFAGRAS